MRIISLLVLCLVGCSQSTNQEIIFNKSKINNVRHTIKTGDILTCEGTTINYEADYFYNNTIISISKHDIDCTMNGFRPPFICIKVKNGVVLGYWPIKNVEYDNGNILGKPSLGKYIKCKRVSIGCSLYRAYDPTPFTKACDLVKKLVNRKNARS